MAVPIIHDDPWPLRVDADGVIRVGKGRMTLVTLLEAWGEQLTPAEIAVQFDLPVADVYSAIGYYLRHQADLRPYLQEQAEQGEKLCSQIKAEQGPFPTRVELQKRLDHQHAKTGQ
jgi:uncharacterized protein (DUF433 family)